MKFFKDILMVHDPEKGEGLKYSLARTSVFLYTIITLFLLILPFIVDIKEGIYDVMTTMVIMLLFLFAGYAFGGKVVSSVSKTKKEVEQMKNN